MNTGLVDGSAEARAASTRLVASGWWLALAAVAVQTVAYAVDVTRLDSHYLLDLDSDRSIFSWRCAFATGAAALAAALRALAVRSHRVRFAALALTTAFFSLDGEVGIHKRLGGLTGLDWQVLYAPALALTAATLLWIAVRGSLPRERWTIVLGLALLAGSIAVEVALVPLGATRELGGRLYHREVAIEEGAQLLGWCLLATACLAGATRALIDLVPRR